MAATFVGVRASAFARSIRNTCAVENPPSFSTVQARAIGERIGIEWRTSRFDVEQFRLGLGVELEHGRRDPATNVSDDDEVTTGKIAWALRLSRFLRDLVRRFDLTQLARGWVISGEVGGAVGSRSASEGP